MKTDPPTPEKSNDLDLIRRCLKALDIVAESHDHWRRAAPDCPSWHALRAELRNRLEPPPHAPNRDEVEALQYAYKLLDWAESIICNSLPMDHCSKHDWDRLIANWRDKKHGVKHVEHAPINFVRLETSTTRYRAEDGQERAVLLWTYYEWLLKEAKRTPSLSTSPERNPHFDAEADLSRKCADLVEIVEGVKAPHDSWRSTHFCGRRLKDTPEWRAFYVALKEAKRHA